MNAEEMFEKLGYKKVDLSSSGYIEYERLIDDKCFSFDFSEEICACSDSITVEELKAINKQCEELGWKNVSKEESELKVLRKAFSEACEILDNLKGDGSHMCPLEYLKRCVCIYTENDEETEEDEQI